MNSLKQAEKYLESLIPKDLRTPKKIMRLERIRALLSFLGNPQDRFFSIHIGGTSGKGSTACFLSYILAKAGFKVGLTLSPHVEGIRERIQINNKKIPEKNFVKLVDMIKQYVEQVDKELDFGRPTYFETLVAVAFWYFSQKKVQIGVVEVGLGGKLDATNVLSSKIQVITSVDLDHTEILGGTVEKIAKDKVEIVKPQSLVVSAVEQASVKRIIKAKSEAKKAKLFLLGEDFGFKIKRTDLKGSVFDFWFGRKQLKSLKILSLGEHQVRNASLALAAICLLERINFKISQKAIYVGLKKAFLPGRFEIIEQKPYVVLDGAHNVSKIKAFLKTLRAFFPKRRVICVLAIKEKKDIEGMVKQLVKEVSVFFCTSFARGQEGSISLRAMCLAEIVRKFAGGTKIFVEEDSKRAFKRALKIAEREDLICVTGSLYLVGEIRGIIHS